MLKFLPDIAVVKNSAAAVIGNPTWDMMLVFLFIAIGFFYGISATRKRIVSLLIYTYVAVAVSVLIPEGTLAAILPTIEVFYLRAGAFIAALLLLYLFLVDRPRRNSPREEPWWQLFFLSFLQIGLLLHIIFSFLPLEKIKELAPVTRTVFAAARAHLWWYLLPLVALAVMKRFERERRR